jgi:hypothetical protein
MVFTFPSTPVLTLPPIPCSLLNPQLLKATRYALYPVSQSRLNPLTCPSAQATSWALLHLCRRDARICESPLWLPLIACVRVSQPCSATCECMTFSHQVKKANPGIAVKEIASKLGEQWRALSDAQKEVSAP